MGENFNVAPLGNSYFRKILALFSAQKRASSILQECEDRVLDGPASGEDKGPDALTPNTVELIPGTASEGG